MNKSDYILIGCEESQIVCKEFRKLDFYNTFSCDLEECSGGKPEWHIQDDVLKVIKEKNWKLGIFHPPCTFLCITGNRWFKPEYKDRYPTREKDRQDAIEFFMKLYNSDIPHVAVENPVGIMSSIFRKPDQYVHPYYFGEPHAKKTGLWLKNLPKLVPTNIVEPQYYYYKDGRKDPMWHMETIHLEPKDRTKVRSQTFKGLAQVIAEQWGNV